jgi:hypothetical protein
MLEVGDLLRVGATGGRVEDGDCLSCLGAYRTGFLSQTAGFIAPEGPPNAVFFRAIASGHARITVFSGDPFHNPSALTAEVDVRPARAGPPG